MAKFMRLPAIHEEYGTGERTLRNWAIKDAGHRKAGESEKGMFGGTARKIGRQWYVPRSIVKRLFGERNCA